MGCASVCVFVCACGQTDSLQQQQEMRRGGGGRGSIYPRKKHNYPKPTF